MPNYPLYKFLDSNNTGGYSRVPWHLPKGKRPGKWMPKVDLPLIVSKRGYHVCRPQDLLKWATPTLYEVEVRGAFIETENKCVAEQARLVRKVDTWNDRTARLFASDCAAHTLHIFEERYPDDKRPRECIEIARRYANGRASLDDRAAARAAAHAARAAAYAAGAAARAAEHEWQLARLLKYINGENVRDIQPRKAKDNA